VGLEDDPNPTKVVRRRSTSKQKFASFFRLRRSILSGTPQFE